jgi:capsular polysaccharide biosynthesis protein
MKAPTEMPRVRDYLHILGRYWFVIVAATALSVGAGWLAHQTTDPKYVASTRVFLPTVGGAEVFDAYNGNQNALDNAVFIEQLALNPQVAKRAIDQLGLDQTPAELTGRITPVVRGVLVEIYVTGDTPELARDTANSVTYNLLLLAHETWDLNKTATDLVPVDVANGASDNRGPLKKYLLLGGLLGLGLSAVLVIALGRIRDKVLTEEQVALVVDEAAVGRNT